MLPLFDHPSHLRLPVLIFVDELEEFALDVDRFVENHSLAVKKPNERGKVRCRVSHSEKSSRGNERDSPQKNDAQNPRVGGPIVSDLVREHLSSHRLGWESCSSGDLSS